MATYENLIHRSMRLVGILGSGETPTTTERDDAVIVLNAIINSWSAEEVSAYNIKHESFSLAPNDSTYTMGPAATFNTAARPVKITSAATISGTFRKSMEVLPYKEAQARYNQIIGPVSEQGITVVLPSILGVDYAFPLLNLLVLPQPSGIVTIKCTGTVLALIIFIKTGIMFTVLYLIKKVRMVQEEYFRWPL